MKESTGAKIVLGSGALGVIGGGVAGAKAYEPMNMFWQNQILDPIIDKDWIVEA